MTTDAPKLTLLGAADAIACEGDACVIPATVEASKARG